MLSLTLSSITLWNLRARGLMDIRISSYFNVSLLLVKHTAKSVIVSAWQTRLHQLVVYLLKGFQAPSAVLVYAHLARLGSSVPLGLVHPFPPLRAQVHHLHFTLPLDPPIVISLLLQTGFPITTSSACCLKFAPRRTNHGMIFAMNWTGYYLNSVRG